MTKPNLKVEQVVVCGMFASNCYLLFDENSKQTIIIDPGGDADQIIDRIKELDLTPVQIWLTHGHLDHLGGTAQVLEEYSVPVWIHTAEKEWCEDAELNGSIFFGMRYQPFQATNTWEDGSTVEGLGIQWNIQHIPGHSPGGVVILNKDIKIAFSGDLVMYGAIGRVDLPASNPQDFIDSLKRFFSQDLGDMIMYPGHGDSTTFDQEQKSNPYVTAALKDQLAM